MQSSSFDHDKLSYYLEKPLSSYSEEQRKKIFKILLIDNTVKKKKTIKKNNIVWAIQPQNYIPTWSFHPQDEITLKVITQKPSIIIPHAFKQQKHKIYRSQKKDEVFSPLWVCNTQIDLIDHEWFGRENVFQKGKKIIFSKKKGQRWEDYVLSKRLEITCGEAPYLVQRYDPTNGECIDIDDRLGILDRKLRVVSENEQRFEEWFDWCKKAYQSTYGYEYQGDNLFLARKNCLDTFIEYRQKYFPDQKQAFEEVEKIAKIISWNLWQMDGLNCSVPYADTTGEQKEQSTSKQIFLPFSNITVNKQKQHPDCNIASNASKTNKNELTYARIYNWDKKKSIEFKQLMAD